MKNAAPANEQTTTIGSISVNPAPAEKNSNSNLLVDGTGDSEMKNNRTGIDTPPSAAVFHQLDFDVLGCPDSTLFGVDLWNSK